MKAEKDNSRRTKAENIIVYCEVLGERKPDLDELMKLNEKDLTTLEGKYLARLPEIESLGLPKFRFYETDF